MPAAEEDGKRSGSSNQNGPGWRELRYPYAPIEPLNPDQLDLIHDSSMTVLEDVGMRIQDGEARSVLRQAGFKVDEAEETVRFDRDRLLELVGMAPPTASLRGPRSKQESANR